MKYERQKACHSVLDTESIWMLNQVQHDKS
jgi:hypothetical protein